MNIVHCARGSNIIFAVINEEYLYNFELNLRYKTSVYENNSIGLCIFVSYLTVYMINFAVITFGCVYASMCICICVCMFACIHI